MAYQYAPLAQEQRNDLYFERYCSQTKLETLVDTLADALPESLDERAIYELRFTIDTDVSPSPGGYYDMRVGLYFHNTLLSGRYTDCHPEFAASDNFNTTPEGKSVYACYLVHQDEWTFVAADELMQFAIC